MVLNFPASPSTGDVHNASNGLAYAFDGVKWTSQGLYSTGTVNVFKLDSIASSFNGSLQTFDLKVNNVTVKPVNDQAVLISVNNVVLEPTVAYSINTNTGQITFTTAPTGGHAFFGILYSRIPVIDSVTNPIQLSNGDKGDITVTNAGAVNEAFTIDAGVISTAKIADDAVTADKLANSINSEIAANTAKISNATHTGDVTGSTSLSIANDAVITSKIADDAVTSAKIAPNAITSSHIAADTVIAADIAANAIGSSELADNAVDTAAIIDNAVTGAKIADNLDIPDNNKIRFGTGNDLEIYHDGSNSFIQKGDGTGSLFIDANGINFRGANAETLASFVENGAVELYHDNVKKAETSSTGIVVTGNVILPDSTSNTIGRIMLGSGTEMQIQYDGGGGFIGNFSGNLTFHCNALRFMNGAKNENFIVANQNGSVDLYYDNSKKLETTSFGATVQGGITFGSDTAAANQLDDYEEGTWTPSLEFGGATTGITYSSMRGGSYVKIGRQVTVNFGFTLTSKGSASGDATIAGLPFAVEDLLSSTSVEASGISSFWNDIATDSANIVFAALGGTSELELRNTVGAEDDTDAMDNGDFDNDTAIRGSITYFTAT